MNQIKNEVVSLMIEIAGNATSETNKICESIKEKTEGLLGDSEFNALIAVAGLNGTLEEKESALIGLNDKMQEAKSIMF